MVKKVSGIYIIVNTVNGKVYVGQAQDIKIRWRVHKSELRGSYHGNRHLQNAWNKYGEKAFQFLILEYCSVEQLDEREDCHIKIYMAKSMCYNIAPEARAPMRGRTASPETRQKLSKASKGRRASDETRQRMSEAAKNRPPVTEEFRLKRSELSRNISPETRQKMSEAAKNPSQETRQKMRENAIRIHTGTHHSEETRRKMSEAVKNRTPISEETRRRLSESHKNPSPEVRQRMSEAHKGNKSHQGIHHSEETRRKLSEANLGNRASEETKRKMSEKQKGELNPFFGKHHSEEARRKMSETKRRKRELREQAASPRNDESAE